MAFRFGIRKSVVCCLFATLLSGFVARPGIVRAQDQVPPPATAAAPLPPPSRQAALTQLGEDFANKVGSDLGAADLYLSGAGKLELAEHASGTHLPDDEPLTLHGIAGKEGLNLPQDIYSIKRGKRLMISLGDLCSAVALASKVNPEKGTAAGWFTRQDQTFSLDAGKGEVVIK